MCELFGVEVLKSAGRSEHPATEAARKRIRETLLGASEQGRVEFGLTIVLIAQELGHYTLANALIRDFGLESYF